MACAKLPPGQPHEVWEIYLKNFAKKDTGTVSRLQDEFNLLRMTPRMDFTAFVARLTQLQSRLERLGVPYTDHQMRHRLFLGVSDEFKFEVKMLKRDGDMTFDKAVEELTNAPHRQRPRGEARNG